jgi:hypothetical protein
MKRLDIHRKKDAALFRGWWRDESGGVGHEQFQVKQQVSHRTVQATFEAVDHRPDVHRPLDHARLPARQSAFGSTDY